MERGGGGGGLCIVGAGGVGCSLISGYRNFYGMTKLN